MSRGNRPRFLVRRFPSTTIQTSKHGDRKPCVQIHCPFRQHRPAAFIANRHGRNVPCEKIEAYPPEVLGSSWGVGPSAHMQLGH